MWSEPNEVTGPDGVSVLSLEERPLMRAVRGERVANFVMSVRNKAQGKVSHLVATGGPIRDRSGQITGAVVVYRDVTETRETERQLQQAQKMEAVGELTGGIAHDFNNILTVITGTIEILADAVADKPGLAAVAKMIDEAAGRGADLTQRLLAFARRQPLQPREIDVNTLVIDATKLLRPTLGEHIEIKTALAGNLKAALVDPHQLSSALLNLAINARDAMPDGGKLTLETSNVHLDESYAKANSEVQPGDYVLIAVSDTGEGIPADIRDRVFEPFFTTKEVGRGTGLGLSMVYGFIKQSGGHIKIYSEVGHGTTIKLYLPKASAEAQAAQEVAGAPIEGGSETILVVEDDASGTQLRRGAAQKPAIRRAHRRQCRRSAEDHRPLGWPRFALHRRDHARHDERPPACRTRRRSAGPASKCCSPRATPKMRSCITAGSIRACSCSQSLIARPIWRG